MLWYILAAAGILLLIAGGILIVVFYSTLYRLNISLESEWNEVEFHIFKRFSLTVMKAEERADGGKSADKVKAVLEAYEKSENPKELMSALNSLEELADALGSGFERLRENGEKLGAALDGYNAKVREYNKKCASFPWSVSAALFAFPEKAEIRINNFRDI